MSALLAAAPPRNYAQFGLLPMALITVAFIINVASSHTKDMNRKSSHATSLFLIALLIEVSTWTVRAFHGGSEAGAFWAVISAVLIHCMSAVLALFAIREHRTVGRWPYGRRRSAWGFWLNVIALLVLAAWFWLGANPKVHERFFGVEAPRAAA